MYAEKVDKKRSGQRNPRSDAEDMRKRLHRLENSILSMMPSDTDKKESSDNESQAKVGDAPVGGQKISSDTRSTHWDAILNDVGF